MDSSQPLASAYVLNPADRSYCCYSNTTMKLNATANPGLYPWIQNGALAESYQIPGEIQEEVETRDEGQCFLTGTSSTLANIHWIFPPIWVKELGRWHMDPHPEHLITDFQTSANAAVMCERFARLFHTNVFGIDVDHGCHVVVFDDRFPKLRDELNGKFGRLPLSGEDGEATMRFLREHFRWCLAACFMSDLDRSQFSDPRYVVEVGELMQTGDEEAVKSARRTYKRDWLTAAGKDTWEQLLNHYWKEEKNIDWDDVSGDEDEEEWPQNESDLFVKAELVARSFSDWDYLYDN
ncbi:hypothetical protein OF83DRAFT_1114982 [Amylostereum chailletii]|nr:hypothetical protein OF83DRAFT_1114982 [Amylostereum chailletii]